METRNFKTFKIYQVEKDVNGFICLWGKRNGYIRHFIANPISINKNKRKSPENQLIEDLRVLYYINSIKLVLNKEIKDKIKMILNSMGY